MFTGLIRHIGTIEKITSDRAATQLIVSCPLASRVHAGDSIAVNGVCLTVLGSAKQLLTFRLMQETITRTNLGQLIRRRPVHLELPLTPSQPIAGHFVLGHIDGLAKIINIKPAHGDKIFTFLPPPGLMPYFIPKGSVALDGVSLTIVNVEPTTFTVSMMPYTLKHTTFDQAQKGYQANIEADVLGKYVARLLPSRNSC